MNCFSPRGILRVYDSLMPEKPQDSLSFIDYCCLYAIPRAIKSDEVIMDPFWKQWEENCTVCKKTIKGHPSFIKCDKHENV
jgi:hypothetical protein